METSPDRTPAPRSPPRALLVVVLALLLVGAVVGVRERGDREPATAVDLQRYADAVEQGCREESSDLAGTTGFALDGTVLSVTRPADPGAPVVVELEVREWFRGPPLDQVGVRLAPGTVSFLEAAGERVGPGRRLLVSGPGWGAGETWPAAAGCGRTRPHDEATAEDWRHRLAAAPVAPEGPVAVYPDAGWVLSTTARAPDVNGVLLEDDGCLYVAEGLVRWVPVFSAGSVAWVADPPGAVLGGHLVDVGHPVRLAGTPATGTWPLPVRDPDDRPQRLDRGGVPAACDEDVPVLVVADPVEDPAPPPVPLDAADRLVLAARDGAEAAGLQPGDVSAEIVRDAYGVVSVRGVLPTEEAGDLLVHVESVSYVAWPHSYVPADATLLWSRDPARAALLPATPPFTELAVVQRADGATQLLLRARPPVVVSVTAGPPGRDGPAGRALLEALAEVARELAYARGPDQP